MHISTGSLFLLVIVSEVLSADMIEPRFNAITKNVTVVMGQTAVLPCSVKSLGNYKIVWVSPRQKTLTLELKRITGDERVSLEHPYLNEWNLHVREVAMKDTGVYMCQINTKPIQVRPIQLIVHQPATIIENMSSSGEIKIKEGDTVELVCNVTGFPTPEVTWYRIPKGLIDDNEREKKNVGGGGEVLMIRNVSRYCDDDYECVAFNGVPPAASKIMSVRVQFPPEVRLPNKKIGQVLGGYTILECDVTAYPLTVTVWSHNGKDITSRGNKYSTNIYKYNESPNKITLTLKIQSITAADYGEYECRSENFLGRDSEIMTLYEYRKKTTPKPTTTTTTTTTAWQLWQNKHGGDGDVDDIDDGDEDEYDNGRQDHGFVNPYDESKNDQNVNGQKSKLQLQTRGPGSRNNKHNDNDHDGSVQPVISDPDDPGNGQPPVRTRNMAFVTLLPVVSFLLTR